MRNRVPVKPLAGKNYAGKTISLHPDLLMWVDAQAELAHRNRSSWIAWALEQLRKGKPVDTEDATAILERMKREQEEAKNPVPKDEAGKAGTVWPEKVSSPPVKKYRKKSKSEDRRSSPNEKNSK
jgi:hypothetical protein